MYVSIRCIADAGDYVIHKQTGEIKLVKWVDQEGSVLVEEYFYLDSEMDCPIQIIWSINDYLVLEKVADIYFDGHFDAINRDPKKGFV